MYCPPKLPFFIKKCSLKLHNLLYIFICINTFSASGVSSSRHDMLNFVPVIPRVKELQSLALTSSRGRCKNYRLEASFY